MSDKLTLTQIKEAYILKGCFFIMTDHAVKRMNLPERFCKMSDIHNIIKTSYMTTHHSIRPVSRDYPIENMTCRVRGKERNGQSRQLAVKINRDGFLVILTVI